MWYFLPNAFKGRPIVHGFLLLCGEGFPSFFWLSVCVCVCTLIPHTLHPPSVCWWTPVGCGRIISWLLVYPGSVYGVAMRMEVHVLPQNSLSFPWNLVLLKWDCWTCGRSHIILWHTFKLSDVHQFIPATWPGGWLLLHILAGTCYPLASWWRPF